VDSALPLAAATPVVLHCGVNGCAYVKAGESLNLIQSAQQLDRRGFRGLVTLAKFLDADNIDHG